MPDMDGFAVLAVRARSRVSSMSSFTAHEQHALRAFEAEALDYLLKPVDPERFERSLERAKELIALRHGQQGRRSDSRPVRSSVCSCRRTVAKIFLAIERIDWVEADGNYVHVHAGPDAYTLRSTLESLGQTARSPTASCGSIAPSS